MNYNIKSHVDKAWVLTYKFDWGTAMLGKYCWKDATEDEYKIKIFRTRQQARKAQKTCCYEKTKIVRVNINISAV